MRVESPEPKSQVIIPLRVLGLDAPVAERLLGGLGLFGLAVCLGVHCPLGDRLRGQAGGVRTWDGEQDHSDGSYE